MTMHNPAHPGEVIRESCLRPLDLTVREAAEHLGVTRKALSDLLNEHSGGSPEMALRLEKAGWSPAETWLRMQMNWNLWRVRQQAGKLRVKKFPQLEPT